MGSFLTWMIAVPMALYAIDRWLRAMLREELNAAADRAIKGAVWRLSGSHDERLYEATRQIVCDGIRRALKAERQDGELQRLLSR